MFNCFSVHNGTFFSESFWNLSCIFSSITTMKLSMIFLHYPVWNLLNILNVWINVFHETWKLFNHHFFKHILSCFVASILGDSDIKVLGIRLIDCCVLLCLNFQPYLHCTFLSKTSNGVGPYRQLLDQVVS